MAEVTVLEVGGTHASAVRVDTEKWTVAGASHVPLDASAGADQLLDTFARCVRALDDSATILAVAIPGPFDYAAGIGRYTGVAKFDALHGVDVGAGLRGRLGVQRVVFVNDAAAFGLGEWRRRGGRLVAITLGTGVGSAFVAADGVAITSGPTVPPGGEMHRVTVDGHPLEDIVSRRGILARYGQSGIDVADIAARAQTGDAAARAAFTEPLAALGAALAPWLTAFGAETVVVGGAMSRSWSLVRPALWSTLGRPGLALERSEDPQTSAAVGAAWAAAR